MSAQQRLLPRHQPSRPPRRLTITEPIDNDQLVALHGNTSPFAIAKNDHGPVSDGLPLPDMTLVLSRSPERQAAFDAVRQHQYDSSSPELPSVAHPAEIGERFGPSETDIATITGWLTSQGFAVTQVTPRPYGDPIQRYCGPG